jgi:SAM-dependent methyltransferase
LERDELDYGKVKAFWNDRAAREGEMDDRSITFFCEDASALAFRDEREKALFSEKAGWGGAEKVLEAGCGSGRWTGFLAQRCAHLVAFDFAPELLAVNRRAAHRAGIGNITHIEADMLSLDMPDRDFDAAICFGVSLYLRDSDLVPSYRNLRRHLRSGGTLFTKEPLASGERIEETDLWNESLRARYSCIYRSRQEHASAVGQAGFALNWTLPVYSPGEPLAPQNDGLETWFSSWHLLAQ